MRRTIRIVVVLGLVIGGVAIGDSRPDPRAEMASALAAQADLQPRPIVLPTVAAAPRHTAAQSAVQRGIDPRGQAAAASANAVGAHEQAEAQAHEAAQALAHQAQAAAAAAAGQGQAQAAKARAGHPHPGK